ncbi:FecR family protein [Pelagerythrobacter rhizovicinus]|uniref:DUF4880 domain-containing protein n=1 Tax=Pelagerythrobacter rhizovicinus TaxID=2268576 RepID=A0A4V1QWJ8_9SPHN|nr:FecR domain-containing protein [Pelagerythrobacter rhizovicinus]RXZ66406.1 DUF4880 domain-containing protein [Pelagerythrobacter rhizovicinus]
MAISRSLESVADQAAEWAVLAEFGEMTPARQAALDSWLAADRRHRGAFLRARAAFYAVEDATLKTNAAASQPQCVAVASDNDNRDEECAAAAELPRNGTPLSRKVVAGGAALAASIALVVSMPGLLFFDDITPAPAPAAALQAIALEDGSVATLGEGARIEVALSSDRRRVMLLSGEATFQVAPEKSRPFVVQSGDVYAQATGTIYSVRRVGTAGGTVKVTEGSVLVWQREERDQAVLLHAGGELTLKPAPRLPAPAQTLPTSPTPPLPELAQFSFDDVAIASAVARFNRVNSTRIVVADPAIGDTRIDGLFEADKPEQFAQAAAAVVGGEVEYRTDTIVIKMK